MNKHYTPEIEEFYIGFEYESYNNTTEKWDKNSLGKNIFNIPLFFTEYNDKKIRVKYLDKEDIESLGFKQISGNWYHDGKTYQMMGNYKSLEISKGTHEYRDILFQGIVKNKSELKKLLKQLNIL